MKTPKFYAAHGSEQIVNAQAEFVERLAKRLRALEYTVRTGKSFTGFDKTVSIAAGAKLRENYDLGKYQVSEMDRELHPYEKKLLAFYGNFSNTIFKEAPHQQVKAAARVALLMGCEMNKKAEFLIVHTDDGSVVPKKIVQTTSCVEKLIAVAHELKIITINTGSKESRDLIHKQFLNSNIR